MMICYKCKQDKDSSDFPKVAKSYCNNCWKILWREAQRKFKLDCLNYLGCKCVDCGYSEPCCLDFHHLHNKLFGIAKARVKSLHKNPKVKAELDKCIVLCANCHAKRHWGYEKV